MKTNVAPDNNLTENADDIAIIEQISCMSQALIQLKDSNENLLSINSDLKTEVKILRERINLLLQKRFGASSEKLNDHQLKLFNEAEQTTEREEHAEETETATTTTVIEAHERKKPQGKIMKNSRHLKPWK